MDPSTIIMTIIPIIISLVLGTVLGSVIKKAREKRLSTANNKARFDGKDIILKGTFSAPSMALFIIVGILAFIFFIVWGIQLMSLQDQFETDVRITIIGFIVWLMSFFYLPYSILIGIKEKNAILASKLLIYENGLEYILPRKKPLHYKILFSDIRTIRLDGQNLTIDYDGVSDSGLSLRCVIKNLMNAVDVKECVEALKAGKEYNPVKPAAETQTVFVKYEQPQTSSVDVPNELRKYKQLLDDGIITQEEYDVKKKQLLGL